MTFSTVLYRHAAEGVCAHEGVALGSVASDRLLAIQRAIGEARRALDALAAEVAGEIQSRADASPGPGGIARQVGFRNAKQLVADALGTSAGEAHRLVNVGKQLAMADAAAARVGGGDSGSGGAGAGAGDEGDGAGGAGDVRPRAWLLVAAAVRGNSLTVEKADILMETLTTLEADAELEREFVELAQRLRPYDLRRVCAREVALGDPAGLAERERRLYVRRCLTLTERMDGMTVVEGLLDPLSAGHFRAWLDAQVRAAFRAKRDNSFDTRTATQIRVDALVSLAHHAMDCEAPGSGFKTTMVVRVDHADLEKGAGVGSCDSLQTPISIGTLRAMAVDAGVLPTVMGGESLPLDVGRIKRLATPYQRMAVLERDGGCAWCHAPASYCDVHHVTGWQQGGETNLGNLVALCVSCHHQIHFADWSIEIEKGVVWFTPPDTVDPERKKRKGGWADLVLAA